MKLTKEIKTTLQDSLIHYHKYFSYKTNEYYLTLQLKEDYKNINALEKIFPIDVIRIKNNKIVVFNIANAKFVIKQINYSNLVIKDVRLKLFDYDIDLFTRTQELDIICVNNKNKMKKELINEQ